MIKDKQAHELKLNLDKNKTRHLRVPIEIRIEITLGTKSFTTTSRNLAIGGISFETLEVLRIGDDLKILLYIPFNKDLELIKIESKIIWVKNHIGSYIVGAAFINFAPGDLKRLRNWLILYVRAQRKGYKIV